ncbi:EthD domain-containing protein [Plesiocystis pacifica]|uniref:EthD domain-containing protein n=1 Tax=Plesiocystis pacifica TaxID=191768 RepID=UPI0002D8CA91|nr:EthD domain-containing protein [Plesiocystis pacifica]
MAEFRDKLNEYGFVVKDIADELGAARVAISTTLAVQDNISMQVSQGTSDPPDAIVEIWMRRAPDFDGPDNLLARQLLAKMRDMQDGFVDLHRSSFFFASERVEHGREAAAALSQRLMRIDQIKHTLDLSEM